MAGKGDRYERRLVKMFIHAGYGAMRLAASGGGTQDDLPDVFAGRPGRLVAIEAKYRSNRDGWCYADGSDADALMRFGERWGCQDVLWGVRFPRDTKWYFYPVDLLERTETQVKWRYDDVSEEWVDMGYFGLTPYADLP